MLKVELLETYQLKNKLKNQEFSDKLGISRETLFNIKKNRTCNLENLIAIANLLNISIDDLIDRDVVVCSTNEEKYTHFENENPINENENDYKIGEKQYIVGTDDVQKLINTIDSQQRVIEKLVDSNKEK